MRDKKYKILNPKKYQISKSQNPHPLPLSHWERGENECFYSSLNRVRAGLIFFCALSFTLLFVSSALAMGGKPPVKQQPKYNLEILKMEFVGAPSQSATATQRVILIVPHKDYQEKELSATRDQLEKAGYIITIASSALTPCRGMAGGETKPDILLKNAKAIDYDAVVFIGGNGALQSASDPQALALAIEAQKNNKVIGAICIAPVILAKAGILENKIATVSPSGRDELIKHGAACTGKAVAVDGKIITANGPAAAEEFGKTLVKALETAR